jgi:hypothetical protein
MVENRHAIRDEFARVLQSNVPAAALDAAVLARFPELSAFREEDDLVLVHGGTRRLLIRRVGGNRFRTSDNVAASGSTNLLDSDDASERDLDALIDEIAAFAAL